MALFLSLLLALPAPVFGLRNLEIKQHAAGLETLENQLREGQPLAAGTEEVRWLAEGVGIRRVGEKEELVISKSLLASAPLETKSVKVVAQQSVSADALMLFNPPRQTVDSLPEEPTGVRGEVERVMEREGEELIVALDASIPVQRMSEYLPQQHPFTVLLEAGKWDQYQGIAQVILRLSLTELRNRIIKFTQGSARTVMIDGQEFVALDISA